MFSRPTCSYSGCWAVVLSSTCSTAVRRCHVYPRCCGVDARSGGALLSHQNPFGEMRSCVWEQRWTHRPPPLSLGFCLCTSTDCVVKGKFCASLCPPSPPLLGAVRFFAPASSSKERRHIVCGAARQCGVRLQPVRWGATGTERSSVGRNSTQGLRRDERERRGISTEREGVYRGRFLCRRQSRSEDISSSAHLYFVFPLATLLTGTSHAASLSTRWTGSWAPHLVRRTVCFFFFSYGLCTSSHYIDLSHGLVQPFRAAYLFSGRNKHLSWLLLLVFNIISHSHITCFESFHCILLSGSTAAMLHDPYTNPQMQNYTT